jgi:hypothetical protein
VRSARLPRRLPARDGDRRFRDSGSLRALCGCSVNLASSCTVRRRHHAERPRRSGAAREVHAALASTARREEREPVAGSVPARIPRRTCRPGAMRVGDQDPFRSGPACGPSRSGPLGAATHRASIQTMTERKVLSSLPSHPPTAYHEPTTPPRRSPHRRLDMVARVPVVNLPRPTIRLLPTPRSRLITASIAGPDDTCMGPRPGRFVKGESGKSGWRCDPGRSRNRRGDQPAATSVPSLKGGFE